MRKLLLLWFLGAIVPTLLAQSSSSVSPTQWQLKVHASFQHRWNQDEARFRYRSTDFQLPHLSLTRQKIGGDFHELSVDQLSLRGRSTFGLDSVQTSQQQGALNANLIYRYGARIHSWSNFHLYLAYQASLTFNRRAAETRNDATIQHRFSFLSLGIGVEPIIQYSLNDRISLEWTIPLGLASGSLQRQRERNVPTQTDWTDTYDVDYRLPQFRAITTRFGLIFSL